MPPRWRRSGCCGGCSVVPAAGRACAAQPLRRRRPSACRARRQQRPGLPAAAAPTCPAACSGRPCLGRQHGVAPDIGGQGAAGDAAGGRGIVIAHPDGGDIVGGEAHEPGVLGILGGAGLARRLAAVQRGAAAGAGGHHAYSIASRSRSTLAAMTRCGVRRAAAIERLAADIHFGDQIGIDAIAAIGEGGIGARSVPAASLRWCPAPGWHWLPAAR